MVLTLSDCAKALADDALRALVFGRPVPELLGQLHGLAAQDLDRLDHFHLALTGQPNGAGAESAALLPDLPIEVLRAAAEEIMALWHKTDPLVLFHRRGPILVRAASRLRARLEAAPTAIRHNARPEDTAQSDHRQPYARFFAVEEVDIRWRRFDGTLSQAATRAAFVSGDAVTVLPYDPVRDRVLVVEQFRAGPHARGDLQPWQIEAIAGRIDPGETPETAARREATEEAGLRLGALHKVAGYYPSPGILSEYLYSYVAITDLPDGVAGVFGLPEEHEDICGHCLSFERLMQLVTTGEVANAPLILTAFWLARERFALRAGLVAL